MKRSDVEKFAARLLPVLVIRALNNNQTINEAVKRTRKAAIMMVEELDEGDWDEDADPINIGGAKVYKGPLSE